PVRKAIARAFGLTELDRLHDAVPPGVTGDAFVLWLMDALGVELRVADADLARIPKSGPVVLVANHPFGGIEGVALARALKRVRPDVKLFANYLLHRIPELREIFFFVDPFARRGSSRAQANAKVLRSALSWLSGGGLL